MYLSLGGLTIQSSLETSGSKQKRVHNPFSRVIKIFQRRRTYSLVLLFGMILILVYLMTTEQIWERNRNPKSQYSGQHVDRNSQPEAYVISDADAEYKQHLEQHLNWRSLLYYTFRIRLTQWHRCKRMYVFIYGTDNVQGKVEIKLPRPPIADSPCTVYLKVENQFQIPARRDEQRIHVRVPRWRTGRLMTSSEVEISLSQELTFQSTAAINEFKRRQFRGNRNYN